MLCAGALHPHPAAQTGAVWSPGSKAMAIRIKSGLIVECRFLPACFIPHSPFPFVRL
jgi:hypothetical protein